MSNQMPRQPFGRTGHESSVALFGAAALAAMRQDKADKLLELLLERGINHIDTAASYGDSELRVGPWMKRHRNGFFLATKTGSRSYQGAKDSIHRSLERLQTDHVDLIQFHNLVDGSHWEKAMGPGGALEAAVEAKEQGLVRFIGVTGHGTGVAEAHLRSLEAFAFDSVLLPYNHTLMADATHAAAFEKLVAVCRERGVAIQTIKAVARRRWQDDNSRRFSWYEPLRDPEQIHKVVSWVLRRQGFFLNTSSDATLLETILDAVVAAKAGAEVPDEDVLAALAAQARMEPIFVRGVLDDIQ